jgi:hypothetical protein
MNKSVELDGTVVSATPDPTPYNSFGEFLDRIRVFTWAEPKPPKVRRP